MFKRILIANRGEIACRVIDTCRRLGVETVAVFSDADRSARHVEMADAAVHIGGSQPSESYLRGDAIIAAARATGAQAIHPGYGFLSENPDFVEAVEDAGLTFIGPSAKAIRAMGLKDAAKKLMDEAGVPVVPGYHGTDQADERLSEEAGKIGYPVLIKAVAGGGGKGMRLVERAGDFADALASARSEAKTAFGNPDVLIEKFVTSPRHIEVQVFGDGREAVHLYERDCSLQRRHQKVIEEAPAPGMTEEMRAAMGEAAVRAAEAIGYAGAGTVEFIVDGSDGLHPDGFWFMEMNTRLQVEHPVTEEVTGIDLVEWQLRVAAGEPLPMGQSEIPLTGHAFEARLYAEDVPAGFLPATGRLAHLVFAPECRAETGVRTGDEISPYYDPMIAKIVTSGATRDIALGKMRRALAGTQVAGTVTNLGFLSALCAHEGFAAGAVDTGLIDRHIATLAEAAEPAPADIALAALAGAGLLSAPGPATGFALWTPLRRRILLERDGEVLAPVIELDGADTARIEIGDAVVRAERRAEGWRLDGARAPEVAITGDLVTVFSGAGHGFRVPDPLAILSAEAQGGDVVEAPMPGLVKAVFVAPGDTVEAGQKMAIMEAMKMEHTLTAPRDGVVAEVLAAEGAQVEAHAALIALAAEEDAA
jgi:3-methylcrotonyl-CoA carboxylase alpha subunit